MSTECETCDNCCKEKEVSVQDNEDSLVCYCYRLTTKNLKDAYNRLGSLKAVEEETRAGTGCTGCKVLLHSLFNERPSDHYENADSPTVGTSCVKPGRHTQKGFIISDGSLESTVYSSNAVAPQLGSCDSTTEIEYTVVDHRGVPIINRKEPIETNKTFVFDTRKEDLPRPFFGMFLMRVERANLGASRFNIYWTNGKSITATHENSATGRPRVFLPVVVDKQFLSGPNTIYTAIMNPHHKLAPVSLSIFDVDGGEEVIWNTELPPYCSTWINANEYLYGAALRKAPGGRYALKVTSTAFDQHAASVVYFFMHNRNIDTWTANHL